MIKLDKFVIDKVISNVIIFYIVSVPYLLSLSTQGLVPRAAVEAMSICLSIMLILYCSPTLKLPILLLSIFLIRLIASGSILISIYDLSAAALILFYTSFFVEKKHLEKAIFFLVISEFLLGFLYYYNHLYTEPGRVGGFFHTSMHYGFSTAGLSIATYLCFSKWKRVSLLVVLWSSVFLSGSRAAGLCVLIVSILTALDELGVHRTLGWIFGGLLTLWLASDFLNIRALTYVAKSDQARLTSYYEWFDRVTFSDLVYGKGRYFLGSVGRVNNGDRSFVTESSVLTFIEAYGILIAFVLLSAPFFKTIKRLPMKQSFFILSAIYITALATPFFETPSILLMNVVLIVSGLKVFEKTKFNSV